MEYTRGNKGRPLNNTIGNDGEGSSLSVPMDEDSGSQASSFDEDENDAKDKKNLARATDIWINWTDTSSHHERLRSTSSFFIGKEC